ncbi:MAG: glycosyltransferase family 39 protein [Acidimicrobiales bacterium]|nr:glycosyltransferase family 39 protein [Acidimicrobiales bacterium]
MSVIGSETARASTSRSVPGLGEASWPEPDRADGATGGGEDELGAAVPTEIVVLALVATAVGIVLRFVARTPLWLDEALSLNIATLAPDQILEALRHDGHPPLYYVLLHYWAAWFGTSDVAVRALSGVFGVAALPLAWIAGRRKGGPVLGWVFLAVFALSPYALRYSTETRMYALVTLLVLVGYLLVDDVVARGRASWLRLVAVGVVSGLLLLTHYWSMWLFGATGLVLAWLAYTRRGDPLAPRALKTLVAMAAGAIVLFGWWAPTMLYQSAHTGTPWADPFRPTVTVSIALTDLAAASGAFADAPLLALSAGVLFLLGLFGQATGRDRIELRLRTVAQFRYEAVTVGLTLGLGIAFGYLSSSTFASRYAAGVFPLFLLVVAGGITRFGARVVRSFALVAVLALSSIGAIHTAFVYQRSQARQIAGLIADHAAPGDVVVYCPDQLGPSTDREIDKLGLDVRQFTYPRSEPPERVDWVDYAARNAAGDPQAFARSVLDVAGDEHAVFVVWAGTYKTLEGQCEQLVFAISAGRPASRTLVDGEPAKFFEHANLSWFGPLIPH